MEKPKFKTHALQSGQERLLPAAGGHDWHGQTVTDRRCWCGSRWTLEGVTVSYGIKPWGRCPIDQVAELSARAHDTLFVMPVMSLDVDVAVLARGDNYFNLSMARIERRIAFEDASVVEAGIGYTVFRNALEAYIEARARRDRFGEAPIHRDPTTGRILVGELTALMSWRWEDGGWKPLSFQELERDGTKAITVNAICREVRTALRRRSGKDWSVTHDRGTAYGWIKIDAPPARCTCDWEGTAPSTNGHGYSSRADRAELLQLLGWVGEQFHPQGLSIPSSVPNHLNLLDRAHGRAPRLQESQ